MKHSYFVPVSLKIYSICLVMLLFLIIVASGNYLRMDTVKQEVNDVAEFIAPISKNVNQLFILSLEQEVIFERILRFSQSETPQHERIKQAYTELNILNDHVEQMLTATISLANQATNSSKIHADIVAFARLFPELRMLQEDHQMFHQLSLSTLTATKDKDEIKAGFLLQQLKEHELVFNIRINRLQNWLVDFTKQSVIEIQRQDRNLLWFNAILSAISIVIGIFIALYTSRKVVSPLNKLIKGSELVLSEKFDQIIPISSQDEIGELTESFNELMRQVYEKELLRSSFQEYVDPRIVRLLSESPEQVKGIEHQATVLFSDIAKFSRLSETLSPEALVAVINEHYNLAGNAILQLGGMVDKYVGDAIVAYWSPPFVDGNSHARLACRAALKHLQQMQNLRIALPDLVGVRKGLPDIDIRIGLATGDIVAGNIGTEKTRMFSILGDPLTLSEELEQANKNLGTHILATEATKNLAGKEFLFRFAGVLRQGSNAEVKMYELCGYHDEYGETKIIEMMGLEKILIQYIFDIQDDARIDRTIQALQEYLEQCPGDKLAQHYYDEVGLMQLQTIMG